MLARRFYALAHHYNDVRLDYVATDVAGEPHAMGSHLNHPPGQTIDLSVEVQGLDRPRIEFVGKGGQVIEAFSAANASLRVSAVSSEEEWVFVRAIDLADQDADDLLGEVAAVSAPIWFRAQ